MFKIAVIGDKNSILAFKAVGIKTFMAEDTEGAQKAFSKATQDKENGIVFVTESVASMLEKEIEKFRDSVLPTVITILGATGNTGIGILDVKKSVERAVGADIIFGGNGS